CAGTRRQPRGRAAFRPDERQNRPGHQPPGRGGCAHRARRARPGWQTATVRPYNLAVEALLKGTLLYLANRRPVYRLIMRHDLLHGLVQRYVAGEELADGVVVAEALNTQGLLASLDYLGESVHTPAEARAAVGAYLDALESIAADHVDAYVSLKLT